MKETFNYFNHRERIILEIVSFLLIIALAFLFFVGMKERNVYFHSLSSLSSKENEYQEMNLKKREKEREWQSWEKTVQDIRELHESHFYDEKEGIHNLRQDIQKIFNEANVQISQIRYTSVKFEKEKFKKINISFTFSGNYFGLKKFADAVEKFPKFLTLENIDFLETSATGGLLKLKMTLAAYYVL